MIGISKRKIRQYVKRVELERAGLVMAHARLASGEEEGLVACAIAMWLTVAHAWRDTAAHETAERLVRQARDERELPQ